MNSVLSVLFDQDIAEFYYVQFGYNDILQHFIEHMAEHRVRMMMLEDGEIEEVFGGISVRRGDAE